MESEVYMMTPDSYESWIFDEPVWKPNEVQKNKYYILSCSGGKDSTAMVLKFLDHNIYIDEIVYVDVGMEMPEMEEHIKKLKKYIKDDKAQGSHIKFTRLKPKKGFRYWLGEHVKTRGKNKGKIGYGWPDHMNRWCTSQLKIQTLKKYYRKVLERECDPRLDYQDVEIVEFVGIAKNEKERAKKNDDDRIKEFNLIPFEMTEEDTLNYCYSKGFDWGGLYEKFGRVSCFCCPLSRLEELKYIYENYPELWLEMRMLDNMSFKGYKININYKKFKWFWRYYFTHNYIFSLKPQIILKLLFEYEKEGRTFRSDYTLRELENKFTSEFYEELFGYEQTSFNFDLPRVS